MEDKDQEAANTAVEEAVLKMADYIVDLRSLREYIQIAQILHRKMGAVLGRKINLAAMTPDERETTLSYQGVVSGLIEKGHISEQELKAIIDIVIQKLRTSNDYESDGSDYEDGEEALKALAKSGQLTREGIDRLVIETHNSPYAGIGVIFEALSYIDLPSDILTALIKDVKKEHQGHAGWVRIALCPSMTEELLELMSHKINMLTPGTTGRFIFWKTVLMETPWGQMAK